MFYSDIKSYSNKISKVKNFDVYNLEEYLRLETKRLDANFVFYHDTLDDGEWVIPFLEREVVINEKKYRDLTMPYGYPGPIRITEDGADLNSDLYAHILTAGYNDGYISAFLRTNPYFNTTSEYVSDNVKTLNIGRTVSIDLRKGFEHIYAGFRKVHRRDIKNSDKYGLTTSISQYNAGDAEAMHKIYTETMQRLNAGKHYFFSLEYFLELSRFRNSNYWIAVSKIAGEVISSSLFSICNGVMQYHLSGAIDHKLRGFATKAMIAEAIEFGIHMDCEFLNLGGGYGGSDDGLFEFKKGFGGTIKPVIAVSMVFDQDVYQKLVKETKDDDETSVHFPAYR